MQALILAAGLGARLKDKTKNMPKGFLPLNGKPIILWSIQKLISQGIDEIIIGTGHCDNFYTDLAKKYPIKTVKNEDFASTGSLATLCLCSKLIKGDFLLLESDLIYDAAGLFVLLNDPRKNLILASGPTQSGDEVYIETADNDVLKNLSKNKQALNSVFGELVGITKLELKTLEKMTAKANPKSDYESAFCEVSKTSPIYVRKLEFFAWREIDDENHLQIAQTQVLPRILENESMHSVKREILLNPGPATTTDSVKYAQVQADICPREKDFAAVLKWISAELSLMAGAKDKVETVLFGGSGTAADEAMISSCIPDDGKLLIVNNGAYGARLAKIASIYKLNFDVYKSDESKPLDVEALKKTLIQGKYTHLAIVYHETTTGILNPVPQIAALCRKHKITTIVDAVSAFAAIPIDMDKDGIDFMASTANKNIGAMAGICFVFCRKEALEKIKNYPMRNFYLNIYDQNLSFQKTGQMRFTPPVQTLYALRQAIVETKLEGIDNRLERYEACWQVLAARLKKLNLKMSVPIEAQSKLITAIQEPNLPNYNFEDFHDYARAQGWTIYPGKVSSAKTFRIANIGDIQVGEMEGFCDILESYIVGLKEKM